MVEVRFAPPAMRGQVAAFMAKAFPRAKWTADGWRALLAGRWAGPEDPFAIIATDDDQLVGVLGVVTAHRPTPAGRRTSVNMSSWYVLKDYRGQRIGPRMITLLASLPDVTITNFTSAPGAITAVERAGLAVLDTHRLTWRPGAAGARWRVHRDPQAMQPHLSELSAQIQADHDGLNLSPCVVETPDGPCFFMLAERQKHDDYVTHEVYHVSNRTLFGAHAQSIAESVLPPAAVLSADARFVPDDTTCDARTALATPRFFSGTGMARSDVDHLYSEVVLLPLKLG